MTTLKEAVQTIKAGDKAKGRSLLLELVKADPQDEKAWLWLSVAVEKPDQKRHCLQKVLEINPSNQTATDGLRQLELLAEAEDEPELQDIVGTALAATNRPSPTILQTPLEQAATQNSGQTKEIAKLYLKLIGFIALLPALVITIVFMVGFLFVFPSLSTPLTIADGVTVNIGLPKELYYGISVLFSGFVFLMLLFPSLLAGTMHVIAVRRLPGGKQAGALQVKQQRQVDIHLPYKDVFHICQELILNRNGHILSTNKADGVILAKLSMNMKSWGETVSFNIAPLNERSTRITVMSKPSLRTAMVDMGRNLENVEAITNYLKLQEERVAT